MKGTCQLNVISNEANGAQSISNILEIKKSNPKLHTSIKTAGRLWKEGI